MNHERAPRQAATDADRTADIVAKMSLEDKIALACADFAAVAHLGLPPLSFTDGGNGVRVADDATAFPACVSLAAAFDEQLAYRFGSAVGQEARSAGHNVLLGPALDIARTPLGGRLPEAFGEDPYLTGVLGAAYVRGAQRNVVAMVKHFVVNNFETGRTGSGCAGIGPRASGRHPRLPPGPGRDLLSAVPARSHRRRCRVRHGFLQPGQRLLRLPES